MSDEMDGERISLLLDLVYARSFYFGLVVGGNRRWSFGISHYFFFLAFWLIYNQDLEIEN